MLSHEKRGVLTEILYMLICVLTSSLHRTACLFLCRMQISIIAVSSLSSRMFRAKNMLFKIWELEPLFRTLVHVYSIVVYHFSFREDCVVSNNNHKHLLLTVSAFVRMF